MSTKYVNRSNIGELKESQKRITRKLCDITQLLNSCHFEMGAMDAIIDKIEIASNSHESKESIDNTQQLMDSISLKNEVFEWLGFCRDYMRPEDVKSLQKILKRNEAETHLANAVNNQTINNSAETAVDSEKPSYDTIICALACAMHGCNKPVVQIIGYCEDHNKPTSASVE